VNGNPLYPKYIRRVEELQIQRELGAVQNGHQSRAVLLYGPGGVGKTSLVRQMARASSDAMTIWLDPIDVDDPECWLLSNLERKVANRLDPTNAYFGPYQRQLSQLPSYTRADISHETIVSYLGRIKDIFAKCYKDYVNAENKTVVIIFDTVETIRGTNLLLTLTQWMKALPTATLFVLSGRPPARRRQGLPDPIRAELESPYHGIPVTTVEVGGFTLAAAHSFLEESLISEDLMGEEKDKLVLLTRGHPLWLAFTIAYLRDEGIPEEAEQTSLDYIEQHLPYARKMSSEGRELHEAFLRRLVAPYRESDFAHEAIKRLAVVRQPIAEPVWQQLMSDRALPEDIATLDVAWQRLLDTPWVRPRGNRRYVTLHDAVAEEFAQRLFPLHDQDQQWRHGIWRRALEIYSDLVAHAEAELVPQLTALNEDLKHFDTARPDDDPVSSRIESELIDHSVLLDDRGRELDLLKAASLYYLFLCDFEDGCEQLLRYFQQAEHEHDAFFEDLLALYLQRFLPGGTYSDAFNDVIRSKLDEFRNWLSNERPDYYIALGVMVARYLIGAAQPKTALQLLDHMPGEVADPGQRHQLHILRGNACMRISGKVKEGLTHFKRALAEAEALTSADRHKFIAEAHKEQGFYYRNTGQWQEADLSYKDARDAISATLSAQSSAEDRDEMASIQTNWAYVKGLNGSYRDGSELVESAITVRHRKRLPEEGMSWSVCGEVYRYARRFEKAWAAYSAAEQLLQGSWGRLGFVYQEQAICLYQAVQDNIRLTNDPIGDAKQLITKALDICLAHSIRGYPSALNRAGRIFGQDDPEAGLKYLRDGINEARRLSDGWFWFANLIEYAELSYRVWARTRQNQHRVDIAGLAQEIGQVAENYSFPDLSGRWSLLQGHLAIQDYLETRDVSKLDSALDSYKSGFADIAKQHVGSSGAASIPGEFKTFQRIFSQLPSPVQADWQAKLRSAWSDLDDGSTLLLARLEELY
jgi:hypothetical protein